MDPTADPLPAEIEAFLREVGMAPTAFGRRAMADPNFVHRVRLGRDPGWAIRARVRGQMALYRETGRFAPIEPAARPSAGRRRRPSPNDEASGGPDARC